MIKKSFELSKYLLHLNEVEQAALVAKNPQRIANALHDRSQILAALLGGYETVEFELDGDQVLNQEFHRGPSKPKLTVVK